VATDGFSGAYFKELAILSGLRRCSIEEALTAIHDRKKMIEQFGRSRGASWGPEQMAPMAMEMESKPLSANLKAGLQLDYRVDHDLALRLVAAAKAKK
jgi:hypothetical protein